MAEKIACPACDAHLSSIYSAFQEERSCPNCGLPFPMRKYLEAEQRAVRAEREAGFLRGQLCAIANVLNCKQSD